MLVGFFVPNFDEEVKATSARSLRRSYPSLAFVLRIQAYTQHPVYRFLEHERKTCLKFSSLQYTSSRKVDGRFSVS